MNVKPVRHRERSEAIQLLLNQRLDCRRLGLLARTALRRHPGGAPQADALIEDLPARVVLADAAYNSDRLRKAIADKGALAVIPNNPSRARRYPFARHLYAERAPHRMLLLQA